MHQYLSALGKDSHWFNPQVFFPCSNKKNQTKSDLQLTSHRTYKTTEKSRKNQKFQGRHDAQLIVFDVYLMFGEVDFSLCEPFEIELRKVWYSMGGL